MAKITETRNQTIVFKTSPEELRKLADTLEKTKQVDQVDIPCDNFGFEKIKHIFELIDIQGTMTKKMLINIH